MGGGGAISVLVVYMLTQFVSTTSAVFPMRSLERIECSIIADSLYDTMIGITIHREIITLSTVESHTHTCHDDHNHMSYPAHVK